MMIYFAVYRWKPQGHSGEYPGTLLSVRNALSPIFSVRICVIRALVAFGRVAWSCARLRLVSSWAGVLGFPLCIEPR